MDEKIYHLLFRIGVIVKAVQSAIELVLGFAFVFASYAALYQAAIFLTGGRLVESPDPLWRSIIHLFEGFSAAPQAFWASLFLSHAVVKIFLIWGLLREKLWSFPLSAAVFGFFVLSQLYQTLYTPSFALWAITIFDVVLIALILHEYRRKKRRI